MDSCKRKEISPLQGRLQKTKRMEQAAVEAAGEIIEQCEREIAELKDKPNLSLHDVMNQMDLLAKRSDARAQRDRALDRIELEEKVIPRIVNYTLEKRLAEEVQEGGGLFETVQYLIKKETDSIRQRQDVMDKKLKETRNGAGMSNIPEARWREVWRREKTRAIAEAEKGVIIFEKETCDGETGYENDEALHDFIMELAEKYGGTKDDIRSWRRLPKPKGDARSGASKQKSKILLRLNSKDARDKLLEKAKAEKDKNLKREIPQILMTEFLELNKEAQRLRGIEKCHTYVGYAGHEIFLRKRKDATDKWRTVMKR